MFSATANRTGRESTSALNAEFRGESQIVDCDGAVVVSAGAEEAVVVADVEPEKADEKANVMCSDFRKEWHRYAGGRSH